MQFLPIKTRKFLPPKDNVLEELEKQLPKLKNGDILFVTSKILAIHQGRTAPINKTQKKKLIFQEADSIIPGPKFKGQRFFLTIKDHTLIANSGIDESNGNSHYILWPKHTQKLLKEIWSDLKARYKLKKFGVVTTDSRLSPLRTGVTGTSIGFFGFEPVNDRRGMPDIFGRKLKVTQINIVDAMSAMAVLLMGEGKEQTPAIILRGAPFIKFTGKNTYKKFVINPAKDIYAPLLKPFLKQ